MKAFLLLTYTCVFMITHAQELTDEYIFLDFNISALDSRMKNTIGCKLENNIENGSEGLYFYSCNGEAVSVTTFNKTIKRIQYFNGDPVKRELYLEKLSKNGFVPVELTDVGLSNYNKKVIIGQLLNKDNVVVLITGNEDPVSSFIFYKL